MQKKKNPKDHCEAKTRLPPLATPHPYSILHPTA